jgi:hypothetical protein
MKKAPEKQGLFSILPTYIIQSVKFMPKQLTVSGQ